MSAARPKLAATLAPLGRRIESLRDWIDGRTLRERMLLLATALAALYAIWSFLLMGPLEAERDALAARVGETSERLDGLDRETRSLAQQLADDPDAENRRTLERLEGEVEALDERLAAHRVGLIPPSEMARVLEDLLTREAELELVRLETLPARPVWNPEEREGEEVRAPGVLFQHDVVIELEGSYLGALRYLRAVEELPWRIYWDELEVRVSEHPTAQISVTVHTLSSEEAWIGV